MNAKLSSALGCAGWLLWLSAAQLSAAIDFTPRYTDLNEDGIRVRTLYILDGPEKVFLDVPAGWRASPGGGGLVLQSDRINQAVIQIREASSAPKAFDQQWQTTASAALLKAMPPNSSNATITNQQENPIRANGWKSYALFAGFDYFGQRLGRAQCIINLKDARALDVVCTSQEKDLVQVFNQAMGLLASWYVVRTSASPSPSPKPSPAPATKAAATPAAQAPPRPKGR